MQHILSPTAAIVLSCRMVYLIIESCKKQFLPAEIHKKFIRAPFFGWTNIIKFPLPLAEIPDCGGILQIIFNMVDLENYELQYVS